MFDPTKPVRLRCGRPARIVCTDRRYNAKLLHAFPIVALCSDDCGEESPICYPANGQYSDDGHEGPLDLVNVEVGKY